MNRKITEVEIDAGNGNALGAEDEENEKESGKVLSRQGPDEPPVRGLRGGARGSSTPDRSTIEAKAE
jgi:hypothetical protein